ncbi:spondin domain-containing protein [Singulisphaera sp. PoT]|uniref:spondin domain-containing protein n=1 Tax=Singulisphaera sp. PoT TaxID=3411797 RepID=UPI003BF4ACFB
MINSVRTRRARWAALSASFVVTLAASRTGSAAPLQITVTNDQAPGGFALSPLWLAAQDGSVATFSPGSTASSSLQALAELGDSSKLSAAFAGQGSQALAGTTQLTPGSSASTVLDVANPATDRYLNFGAMVVPSNDFFLGNSDAKGFQLFDAGGHFVGPTTIQIFGHNVWDAGTEVNNIQFGAAFVVGDNAADHVDQNGVISPVFGGATDPSAYLNSILGKATPKGYDISHLISSDDLIATIQISAVPEPSTFAVLGLGIMAMLRKALPGRRSIP